MDLPSLIIPGSFFRFPGRERASCDDWMDLLSTLSSLVCAAQRCTTWDYGPHTVCFFEGTKHAPFKIKRANPLNWYIVNIFLLGIVLPKERKYLIFWLLIHSNILKVDGEIGGEKAYPPQLQGRTAPSFPAWYVQLVYIRVSSSSL